MIITGTENKSWSYYTNYLLVTFNYKEGVVGVEYPNF